MFIAETYPFSRKLPGKRKFSRNEISRKFAHFRIIFAFRENGKKHFRFNPTAAVDVESAVVTKTCLFIPSHEG
jgi:hypothetical protein